MKERKRKAWLVKEEGSKNGSKSEQSRGTVAQSYLNKESGERKKYKRKSGKLKKYTKIKTIKEGNKVKEWIKRKRSKEMKN